MLQRAKTIVEDLVFKAKMAKQRAIRGFDDMSVWNHMDWFLETVPAQLRELAKDIGVPRMFQKERSLKIETTEEFEAALAEYRKELHGIADEMEEVLRLHNEDGYLDHSKLQPRIEAVLARYAKRFFELWN